MSLYEKIAHEDIQFGRNYGNIKYGKLLRTKTWNLQDGKMLWMIL